MRSKLATGIPSYSITTANMEENSSWMEPTVFSNSVQALVNSFLEPLEMFMGIARFRQSSPSTSSAPVNSAHTVSTPGYLEQDEFVNLTGYFLSQIHDQIRISLTLNQIVLISMISIFSLILVSYYARSFRKEKQKIPE